MHDVSQDVIVNIDDCDKKINEILAKVNPSLLPSKLSEGLYRFGTKKLAISLIKDIPYIRIQHGYISAEDFFRYYTRIELNRIKQLRGHDLEFTDMINENIPAALRQLVIFDEEKTKLITKNQYGSTSPKLKSSKENNYKVSSLTSSGINTVCNSTTGSSNKTLHIEISKSNEGYIVRNKATELSQISPKVPSRVVTTTLKERKKGALENILNQDHKNMNTTITNYTLSIPTPSNHNNYVPNLFSSYYENEGNRTTPASAARLRQTIGTNNNTINNISINKSSTSVEKNVRINVRKY